MLHYRVQVLGFQGRDSAHVGGGEVAPRSGRNRSENENDVATGRSSSRSSSTRTAGGGARTTRSRTRSAVTQRAAGKLVPYIRPSAPGNKTFGAVA